MSTLAENYLQDFVLLKPLPHQVSVEEVSSLNFWLIIFIFKWNWNWIPIVQSLPFVVCRSLLSFYYSFNHITNILQTFYSLLKIVRLKKSQANRQLSKLDDFWSFRRWRANTQNLVKMQHNLLSHFFIENFYILFWECTHSLDNDFACSIAKGTCKFWS